MFSWLLELTDRLRDAGRRRRSNPDAALGRRGEDLAHRHLRRQGFRVVARNYRTRSGSGDIDLIAWDGETLAFVEVKSRTTDEFGAPERAIGQDKRLHMARAAREYAYRSGVELTRIRFDVVSVVNTDPPQIVHTRDAFRMKLP